MVYQLLSSPNRSSNTPNSSCSHGFSRSFSRSQDFSFLSAVLEGFTSGILVLTREGDLLHANQTGQAFAGYLRDLDGTKGKAVPASLWTICGYLEESRELFPDSSLVLTQDFIRLDGCHLRTRVQWLNFEQAEPLLFLVVIEEYHPSSQVLAAS
ncbi:MAG: PAS domain-containing protein [Nodosilinea sp. LVE1205-7]|jgi:PAS domain-containing protein